MKILPRNFFLQNTDEVAQQLLGKLIIINSANSNQSFQAIITETESYHGDDPVSHAARSRTLRNEPMFWQGGHLYIYFIYGMYYCLNIDKTFDRLDICNKNNQKKFGIYDINLKPKYETTKRIGISKNKDALLRFIEIN